jgi:hypothetical protein
MDTRRHLYHARIDRHLTLEQIGVRTALSPTVLRNLDEGRFERLPSGLYARSYVRAFAAAVGLDAEEALASVEHLLPGAPEPVPALSAKDPSPAQRTSKAVLHGYDRARAAAAGLKADAAAKASALREMLLTEVRQSQWSLRATTGLALDPPPLAIPGTEGSGRPSAGPRLRSGSAETLPPAAPLRVALPRYVAALVDAVVLLVGEIGLVMLVAQSSSVPVHRLLEHAGLALASFCAMPVLLYFLFFEGIAGTTPGQYAVTRSMTAEEAPERDHQDEPLTLLAILERTVN